MTFGSAPASSWHGSLRREMNLRQFSALARLSCSQIGKAMHYAVSIYMYGSCFFLIESSTFKPILSLSLPLPPSLSHTQQYHSLVSVLTVSGMESDKMTLPFE